MQNSINTASVVGLFAIAVAMLVGCGGFNTSTAIQDANATNAQRLANLYAQHQRENKGAGPKDEARFRMYIEQVNPVLLERIDVDPNQIDALFTSERDGEVLEIRYGVKGNDMSEPEPVVFEKTGVEGVRLVAFTGQKVEQISDDAEYQSLLNRK